jgi:aspartate aminotransferase
VEGAFDVLVRARALEAKGRSIIHLEIGEPDFPTPAHIVEAAKRALDEGWTHYGPPQGFPELREAVAEDVSRRRGIRVGPEHVSIVPGGKPMIFFPMLALLEPGDEVIYPNPGFPIYESMIRTLGATPVPMPLVESRGFSFDLNLLRDKLSGRTKMLVLNSPQNPTGGVIPEEDMRAIADMVRDRDLIVLADEIYSRIYYEDAPVSIASYPGMLEKTIILDGFSKTYAMTGWRMGYGVMPTWLVEAVNKLMVNSCSCVAQVSRNGRGSRRCAARRSRWTPWSPSSGGGATLSARAEPDSGFPLYGSGGRVLRLCQRGGDRHSIERDGRFSAGGGRRGGPEWRRVRRLRGGYIRFSYANSLENLMEAVARIEKVAVRWAAVAAASV